MVIERALTALSGRATHSSRLGERTYVYGRWDRLFRLLAIRRAGTATPFAPSWPLLDRRGRPSAMRGGCKDVNAAAPSLECPEYPFRRYVAERWIEQDVTG
jgi:hypothetical protein